MLEDVIEVAEGDVNENLCRECGAELDDAGDGYDGLCGECADRHFEESGE